MGESSTFLTEILGERYEIFSKLGAGAFGEAGTTVVLTTKGEEAVLEEGASFSVRLRSPLTATRESPR